MKLIDRYQRLNLWNKLAVWAGVASLVGLPLALYSCSQTNGDSSSRAEARNDVRIYFNPELAGQPSAVYDVGSPGTNYMIDFRNGASQFIELSTGTVFSATGWPPYTAKLILYIKGWNKHMTAWQFVDFWANGAFKDFPPKELDSVIWVGEFIRHHGKIYGRQVAWYPATETDAKRLWKLQDEEFYQADDYKLFRAAQKIQAAKGLEIRATCVWQNCQLLRLRGEPYCPFHYFTSNYDLEKLDKWSSISDLKR